ncbi:hypothetical protein BCD49_10855 [Pseudofrankia sp. EUN1h]|nr:hypothetical protein BCD49_10855 [Pseudofrankia sp. EUN1h]
MGVGAAAGGGGAAAVEVGRAANRPEVDGSVPPAGGANAPPATRTNPATTTPASNVAMACAGYGITGASSAPCAGRCRCEVTTAVATPYPGSARPCAGIARTVTQSDGHVGERGVGERAERRRRATRPADTATTRRIAS